MLEHSKMDESGDMPALPDTSPLLHAVPSCKLDCDAPTFTATRTSRQSHFTLRWRIDNFSVLKSYKEGLWSPPFKLQHDDDDESSWSLELEPCKLVEAKV